MTIDLYYMPESGPCRAIQMVAKAIGVDLNLKSIDLRTGDHLKPEFLKMNPQHTVPTLDDNGFRLWESRAITGYLVDKYAKNDSLYPKDPKKRALVDQRLYFDMGTLTQRYAEYFYPQVMAKQPADPEKKKKCYEALEWLNTFLESNIYVAGNSLTIADITLVTTISTYEAVGIIDFSKYSNISKWYAKCKETISGYEINLVGVEKFKQWIESAKAK